MPDNDFNQPVRLSERAGAIVPLRRRMVHGRYDNAETTDENAKYWAAASDLAPDDMASIESRRKLRARCRYECRNNSWANGIKGTLANDCIGTGPRLQLLGIMSKSLRKRIEMDFWRWSEEIQLPEKLRTMRAGRVESGEAFGLLANNPGLMSAVKLDLSLVEPEQVTAPWTLEQEEWMVDGIRYDQYGNPLRYWVARYHPGDASWAAFSPDDFDVWPARYVLHYFRPDRPSQHRGVPDLTPAVDQFMELRRYSKAVIAAAETAADFSAVLYSDAPVNDDQDVVTVEAMDKVELARRMATTLPQGWKLGQIQAEQPTTTYDIFVKAKLAEIARCLNVPLFVAGLDARDANMSSAYVVGQTYARTIAVDRSDLERLLNRMLDAWLEEWIKVNPDIETPDEFERVWQWDATGTHADPGKVATAQATQLAAGVTNIPREYSKAGLDWEDEQESAAKAMGMSVAEYRERLAIKLFGPPGGLPGQGQSPGTSEANDDEADQP